MCSISTERKEVSHRFILSTSQLIYIAVEFFAAYRKARPAYIINFLADPTGLVVTEFLSEIRGFWTGPFDVSCYLLSCIDLTLGDNAQENRRTVVDWFEYVAQYINEPNVGQPFNIFYC
jgi:hypothetical protein